MRRLCFEKLSGHRGLFLLLLLVANTAFAQKAKFPWKQFGMSGGVMFTAGWLDNEADVAKFNFHLYKVRWPNTNPQWSNPLLSARNKYANWPVDKGPAYPGSKTWLVWTTDKYHMNRFMRNALVAGAVAVNLTIGEKLNWKQIAAMAAGNWAAFALGSGASAAFYKMGD